MEGLLQPLVCTQSCPSQCSSLHSNIKDIKKKLEAKRVDRIQTMMRNTSDKAAQERYGVAVMGFGCAVLLGQGTALHTSLSHHQGNL